MTTIPTSTITVGIAILAYLYLLYSGILIEEDDFPFENLAEHNTSCSNREPDDICEEWASEGACNIHQNMGWMGTVCAKSCATCSLLHYPARCNRKRIPSKKAIANYELGPRFIAMADRADKLGMKPRFLSKGPSEPYILELSNFVSDLEIEAILRTTGNHFIPSQQRNAAALTSSGTQPKLLDERRVSETAECNFSSGCKGHPEVRRLINRMEHVLGISELYFENLQVLRYKPGMYYKRHYDMSEKSNKLVCGPRIFTLFLYLNDVEHGGGTSFPLVGKDGVVVQPRKGKAVIWPSVLEEDVMRRDNRTIHEALPVESGIKYGTNVWVRQHDYVNASRWGCAGVEF